MPNLDLDAFPIGILVIDQSGEITALNHIARSADIWCSCPDPGDHIENHLAFSELNSWLCQGESTTTKVIETNAGKVWQLTCSKSARDTQIFLQDISNTKALERENAGLKVDIERLDLAMQGANIGIWDFNPSIGQIIGNKTWATQKALSPEDIFADDSLFSEIINGIEKWGELVHPDDLEKTTQLIQDHLDGKSELYHAEFRVKCGDGRWKWILDQGRVFERDEQGNVTRMNGIHVDVDKLKELQHALMLTKDKAEVANRAKSTFLANMSHELRTPLNAILGYSQLIKSDRRLSPQHREYLEIINRSGGHLLSLINDVLDMSKIDAGHNVIEQKWFSFVGMIDEVRELMRMRAMEKQLLFQYKMSSNAPTYVCGDEAKIRQILINLIGNAIKFTNQGHVILSVDFHRVSQSRYKFVFEVADTGIGIAPQDLKRVFKPFEQVASENTQNGTGLGLSISKQFADSMQGSLEVKSRVGRGATFTFQLDMEGSDKVSQMKPQAEEARSVYRLKDTIPSPKILVAEDQVDNQTLIRTLLENAGFTVKVVSDGKQAVEMNRVWQPDYIWMDRRMPNKDGLAATREIRREGSNHRVKIVALTASVFSDEVEKMLASGMDDFVKKPFLPHEIYETMLKHLPIEYESLGESFHSYEASSLASENEWIERLSQQQIAHIVDLAEQGEQDQLLLVLGALNDENEVFTQPIDWVDNYQFDQLIDALQIR